MPTPSCSSKTLPQANSSQRDQQVHRRILTPAMGIFSKMKSSHCQAGKHSASCPSLPSKGKRSYLQIAPIYFKHTQTSPKHRPKSMHRACHSSTLLPSQPKAREDTHKLALRCWAGTMLLPGVLWGWVTWTPILPARDPRRGENPSHPAHKGDATREDQRGHNGFSSAHLCFEVFSPVGIAGVNAFALLAPLGVRSKQQEVVFNSTAFYIMIIHYKSPFTCSFQHCFSRIRSVCSEMLGDFNMQTSYRDDVSF